jgi:hypothetical protein
LISAPFLLQFCLRSASATAHPHPQKLIFRSRLVTFGHLWSSAGQVASIEGPVVPATLLFAGIMSGKNENWLNPVKFW